MFPNSDSALRSTVPELLVVQQGCRRWRHVLALHAEHVEEVADAGGRGAITPRATALPSPEAAH